MTILLLAWRDNFRRFLGCAMTTKNSNGETRIPFGDDNQKDNNHCKGNSSWLAFFESFEFVEGAGPVLAEEA